MDNHEGKEWSILKLRILEQFHALNVSNEPVDYYPASCKDLGEWFKSTT